MSEPRVPALRYPGVILPVGHVEPVPRRVRAQVGGRTVLDTRRALYVWESPAYPQFCVPLDDLVDSTLVEDSPTPRKLGPGPALRHSLVVGDETRRGAAHVWAEGAPEEIVGTARFTWHSLDAWFEEDERVFVHPRSPYTRVDALRAQRSVRVEVEGTVLCDAPSTVIVFETGLPPRYYIDPVYVDWTRMTPTDTVTACPYKGTTSGYWSFTDGAGGTHKDILWAYDFPTVQLSPIAGMVAFYDEKVDMRLDGVLVERPTTTFS